MKKIRNLILTFLLMFVGVVSASALNYTAYKAGDEIEVKVKDAAKLKFYVVEDSDSDSDMVTAVTYDFVDQNKYNFEEAETLVNTKKEEWKNVDFISLPSARKLLNVEVNLEDEYSSQHFTQPTWVSPKTTEFTEYWLSELAYDGAHAVIWGMDTHYNTQFHLSSKKNTDKIYVKLLVEVSKQHVVGGFYVSEEEYVAKIGEEKYTTIEEALNDVMDNEEIILLNNIENLEISKDKKLTINLSNFTITSLKNSGELTLKGPGTVTNVGGYFPTYVVNHKSAKLTINNIDFITKSNKYMIENEGLFTINSATFKYTEVNQEDSKFLLNKKDGTVIINSGTFTGGVLFENLGNLTINNGKFELSECNVNKANFSIKNGEFKNSKGAILTNTRGIVDIDGGVFDAQQVVNNGDNDYASNNENIPSIINVNSGVFNVTSTAFSNDVFSNYSVININGGEINLSSEDYVLANRASTTHNFINVLGGTINAPKSKGLFLYGDSNFIIGKNDDVVSQSSPIISIPLNEAEALGEPKFEFYDGKIITTKSLDKNGKLVVANSYYVKYDENGDGTYTAYLEKIGNDISEEPKEDSKEDQKDTSKEESNDDSKEEIKNPSTGINFGYTILIFVVAMCLIGYFIIRKQSRFPKHN